MDKLTKKFWTVNEDKYFLKTVIDVVGEQSGTLNDACQIVSRKLGRSLPGCKARYKNKIKNQVPHNIQTLIFANNPRNASFQSKQLKEEGLFEFNEDEFNETNEVGNKHLIYSINDNEEEKVYPKGEFSLSDNILSEEDFSDIPNLLKELMEIDLRRSTIKERIKRYHEFIGHVLKR